MTKKIAFCFLLYEYIKHNTIWEKFFLQDSNCTHSIYSHIKNNSEKTQDWLKSNQVKTIKTTWCDESLVHAWINMLKKALQDKDNKYFVLLSGECIPLYNYTKLYTKITRSKKSRINLNKDIMMFNKKLYDFTGLYYADQWMILNRTDAKILTDLLYTNVGRKWLSTAKNMLCWGSDYLPIKKSDKSSTKLCLCPDEIYPINWFSYKLGSLSSKKFKKHFVLKPTTFTHWDGTKPHPKSFNLTDVLLNDITLSKMKQTDALFARKFSKRAANYLLN